MKLMTLNIWGGHVRSPLLEFIERHREIDIFCFQEVYHNALSKISDDDKQVSLNIFAELQALLKDHRGFFRPVVENAFGIGMFIKKEIEVVEEGEIPIYHNPNYRGLGPSHSRNLQWVKCRINDQIHTIVNIHGLWNGMGKTDSPERISQAQTIREFVNSLDTPKILCGDFNLRPDTESMKIIGHQLNNLISAHNISCTRTSFYEKEERFADYILTSPEISIGNFKVLDDEVSDHRPLLLEFI